jgi:hypothetical protein
LSSTIRALKPALSRIPTTSTMVTSATMIKAGTSSTAPLAENCCNTGSYLMGALPQAAGQTHLPPLISLRKS